MITLTVYGGCATIGGNKILLEDADSDSRLFFDFGTSFKVREQYFEEYLKPRTTAGLLDLLEMDHPAYGHLLPPIEGIYRPDLLPPGDAWSRYRNDPHYRELPGLDGVLVSHAHIDHTGYISFLQPETPVYASAMSAFIAKAMQDSAGSDFESEVCYARPRIVDRGDGDRVLLVADKKAAQLLRPYVMPDCPPLAGDAHHFWYETPQPKKTLEPPAATPPAPEADGACRVGRLRARCWPVDHSIHGAVAWGVETAAGWVLYTGDLRLHGSRGDATRRFIAEARSLQPRALLCEGTRAPLRGDETEPEPPPVTEQEVEDNAHRHVAGEDGLVIADFGPRNIERLQAFLRIAQATGRTLVVLPKDAYLLDAMHLADPAIPTVASEAALRVYCDLKAAPQRWEQGVRQKYASSLVTPDDIAGDQRRFVLCFSFWDMKNVIDIAPRGGTYIYSSSEAYTEDQRLDLWRLRNWLAHFGLRGVGLPRSASEEEDVDQPGQFQPGEEKLHASGHATAGDLIALAKEIRPRTLVPIHTENPRFFHDALSGEGIEIVEPLYGMAIALG
jgi:ribonuclease J